jgi:hypothetical protein
MVDLGSNYYAKAKVYVFRPCVRVTFFVARKQTPNVTIHRESLQRLCVMLGLGLHVELTVDEAIIFIDQKEIILNRKAERLTEKAAIIKANIAAVRPSCSWLPFSPSSQRTTHEKITSVPFPCSAFIAFMASFSHCCRCRSSNCEKVKQTLQEAMQLGLANA